VLCETYTRSDKRLYVNFHSLQRCFERLNTRRAAVGVGDRRRPLPRGPGSLPGPGADGLHAIPRFAVSVAHMCHDLRKHDLGYLPTPEGLLGAYTRVLVAWRLVWLSSLVSVLGAATAR
jgi:hypothetical protein